MLKILLIEPYYTGSHKKWANDYRRLSNHNVKILSLKGQFWKWRMHGGAVTLADKFNKINWKPNLIIATDMLDFTTFLSLTRKKTYNIPAIIYFHENQISYPWSPNDIDVKKNRDSHYGFINYSSALSSDHILFNSNYHMNTFMNELNPFLKNFPDHNELDSINIIKRKSKTLHLGLDLKRFDLKKIKKKEKPSILWNHRWEYDKNPELFFSILEKVKNEGYKFNLIVIGENFSQSPKIFDRAKKDFKDELIHWGYAKTFELYAELLWRADILPVTSNQEFFGISVMEAIYCGNWPILPNRLTYPELLPEVNHKENIYQDEKDLYKKIINAIVNIENIRKTKLSSIASKFSWDIMVPVYDDFFSNVSLEYQIETNDKK
jgi:glycosyltransferase involved in cell wall biosynthesis